MSWWAALIADQKIRERVLGSGVAIATGLLGLFGIELRQAGQELSQRELWLTEAIEQCQTDLQSMNDQRTEDLKRCENREAMCQERLHEYLTRETPPSQ